MFINNRSEMMNKTMRRKALIPSISTLEDTAFSIVAVGGIY